MKLESLLVCSDERILRVLHRVLDELAIEVEHCAAPTAATKLLARQTFEAVIVDCAEERNISLLKSIRMGGWMFSADRFTFSDQNARGTVLMCGGL